MQLSYHLIGWNHKYHLIWPKTRFFTPLHAGKAGSFPLKTFTTPPVRCAAALFLLYEWLWSNGWLLGDIDALLQTYSCLRIWFTVIVFSSSAGIRANGQERAGSTPGPHWYNCSFLKFSLFWTHPALMVCYIVESNKGIIGIGHSYLRLCAPPPVCACDKLHLYMLQFPFMNVFS